MNSWKVNYKFLALGCFFLIAGILLRACFLYFDMNLEGLKFWAWVVSFAFVFFLFAGFSAKDHVWWKMVVMALALILFNYLLNYKVVDASFQNGLFGILAGMALVSISFVPAVKKWLTS